MSSWQQGCGFCPVPAGDTLGAVLAQSLLLPKGNDTTAQKTTDAQMRVLLRSTESKSYLQDEGQWTADRGAARDFGTSGRAILFATEHRLGGLEVVLAFDNPLYDLSIPLQNGLLNRPGRGYREPEE